MTRHLSALGGALLAAALTLALAATSAHAAPKPDDRTATSREAQRASATLAEATAVLAGDRPGDLTLVLRDLRLRMDDLSGPQRAAAEELVARPVAVASECSATTCIHDVTGAVSGSHLIEVLGLVDDVRATYVAAGYRPPLDDGLVGGGPELDIYLDDIGADSFYGYCYADGPNDDGDFDASAYCVLDDDFSETQFFAPPEDSLRVTVAHEYFHAIQFAYDFAEDGWFMEATATWMEEQLFDDVNDNRQYLGTSQLAAPGRSLDRYGANYHYGAWIFFGYLGERFPARLNGIPTIVRDMWRYADGSSEGPDYYSVGAIQKALADRGSSFAAQYARFAVANRSPRSAYSEGSAYRAAPATNVGVSASRRNPAAAARTLDHLTSATIRYTPSRLTASDWRLKLVFNLAPKSRGSMAAVKVFRRNGSTTTTYVALNASGDATARVPFSSASVSRVEVTLVNASRRFSGCWSSQTPYPCSGTSVDDNLRQIVDPLAYRA